MILARSFSVVLVAALLVSSTPLALAKPPTAPGRYHEWDDELDEVEVVQSFHLGGFHRLLVLPISSEGMFNPTAKGGQSAVRAIVEDATKHFAKELEDELPGRAKIKAAPAPANTALRGNPGALILRARFTEMNAGSATSRAASMGFAGGTAITMEGEFLDGGTGQVLLRFRHRNKHGNGGLFDLNSRALEQNENQIADKVGGLLKAFYP